MIKTIRSYYRRIKRTIAYLPIIWKGYDFDYRHALDLFHYQLTRLADFLDSDKAYSVKAKQDARRLRTILELMKKVYDEEYRMQHFDQMERFWGGYETIWERTEGGDYRYGGMKWKWAHTPEKQAQAERQFTNLAIVAEKKHQRAKKLLWKLVEHNLEHMWD